MIDLREFKEFIKDTFAYIILAIIIAIIFIYLIAIVPVAGNSMNPNLNDGDLTFVVRPYYYFFDVERGDIVNVKTDDKLRYVKRIIGLPGENISFLDNKLLVNGNEIEEDYLNDNIITYNFLFEDVCPIDVCEYGIIPEDKYLVLGDNREESKDSREFGLIDKSEINGKVLFKIWPIK